jgi:hypothetical protein
MRLWTLHPRYLDSKGLVALWREGLLARKVLAGQTRGYRHHPQLERFRAAADPMLAIDTYLHGVADEADARSYRFQRSKLPAVRESPSLESTDGQVEFERQHLLGKLRVRAPQAVVGLAAAEPPSPHPLFSIREGPVEAWERPGPQNAGDGPVADATTRR